MGLNRLTRQRELPLVLSEEEQRDANVCAYMFLSCGTGKHRIPSSGILLVDKRKTNARAYT